MSPPPRVSEISVRLVGGGKYYGRVEITHDNHTGSICDKAWSTSDARVVCKQLNFADGDPVTGKRLFFPGYVALISGYASEPCHALSPL